MKVKNFNFESTSIKIKKLNWLLLYLKFKFFISIIFEYFEKIKFSVTKIPKLSILVKVKLYLEKRLLIGDTNWNDNFCL